MDFSGFSSQVTLQISDLKNTIVFLQSIVQSLSKSQGELSAKVDYLLKQQNSGTPFGSVNYLTDNQARNEKSNEKEILQEVVNLKRDLRRKSDSDKELKAEVLQIKIQNDIRIDSLERQLSNVSNNLSSLEKHVYRYEHFETAEKIERIEKTLEVLLKSQDNLLAVKKKYDEPKKDREDLEQLKCKIESIEQMLSVTNKRIEDVKQQKVELETEIEKIKKSVIKLKVPSVGFTAFFNQPVKLEHKDLVLTGFKDVRVNKQDVFNPDSGYFTAPVDGLYAVSVTLCQMSTGYLEASVIHRVHISEQERWVGRIVGHREVSGTSDTNTIVVPMKSFDKLCVKVTDTGLLNNPSLSECTSFSCFLINHL